MTMLLLKVSSAFSHSASFITFATTSDRKIYKTFLKSLPMNSMIGSAKLSFWTFFSQTDPTF